MKIIDSNGRLFKKFNIIDVIVALLVLVIIVAIGWKVVSASLNAAEEKRAAQETAQEQSFEKSDHLIFKVVCTGIQQSIVDGFEASLQDRQVMNNGTPVEAYITDCTSEPAEDGKCTVFFTIEATLIEKDDIYSVGTQEVRVGKPYIVKTYQIETSGNICSMEVKKHE